MGITLHYQAIPEGSQLARRLRGEQALCVMYAELIHQPAGPPDARRLPPDELGELLAEIARNPVFGSSMAAERVFADLLAELDLADEQFPGLLQRSAYLKLVDLDERLARAVARIGRTDAAELASALVFGAGALAPDGFSTENVELQVVPAALVSEAAGLLVRIEMEAFQGWQEFRKLYLQAAASGEAIVIG